MRTDIFVHPAHSHTIILEYWLAHGGYLMLIAECKKEPLMKKIYKLI